MIVGADVLRGYGFQQDAAELGVASQGLLVAELARVQQSVRDEVEGRFLHVAIAHERGAAVGVDVAADEVDVGIFFEVREIGITG